MPPPLPPPPPAVEQVFTTPNKKSVVNEMLDTSTIFNSGFTGVKLWDIAADTMMYSTNADKRFTAASNAKILTLFASLQILGDSIPALRYVETDKELIFWGTGDPTFLNDKFNTRRTYDFLKEKSKTKQLVYRSKEVDAPYGEGWMWDDYNGAYQPEISAFPIYENMTHFSYTKNQGWSIIPLPKSITRLPSKDYTIKRQVHSDAYSITTSIDSLDYYKQSIPVFDVQSQLIQRLSDTLKTKIELYIAIKPLPPSRILYSMHRDTVLKEMMRKSDNFLAEHLILTCGSLMADTLSTSFVIDSMTRAHLGHFKPKVVWVDGAGLSRYNLLSPDINIWLLRELYKSQGTKIFDLMAIGGQPGTIKNLFTDQATPYVFAKTGTLSHVFNLSGYLIAKSGKLIAFSIMNNQFEGGTAKIRQEVQSLVKMVRDEN